MRSQLAQGSEKVSSGIQECILDADLIALPPFILTDNLTGVCEAAVTQRRTASCSSIFGMIDLLERCSTFHLCGEPLVCLILCSSRVSSTR